MTVLAALLAGGLAACARYALSLTFARRRLPWAVLVINVVASAIAGVALGLAARWGLGDDIRLVLISGVAGGLSTFSTLSVETVQLVLARRWSTAALSIAANLALGIAAAAVGFAVGNA